MRQQKFQISIVDFSIRKYNAFWNEKKKIYSELVWWVENQLDAKALENLDEGCVKAKRSDRIETMENPDPTFFSDPQK